MPAIRPLLLSAADVERAAPPLAEIVAIVERTYRLEARGQVEIPAKVAIHPGGGKPFLHAMPAWVDEERALGMKWVSFFPGNAAHGLPDSSALIVLNDPDSGLPIAIMDGMWITYARTSACAALAARLFGPPAPTRLGLVGCGGLGRWSLQAISAVFPSIREVRVASRRPETRRAFCADMAAIGPWTLEAVDDVEDAVRGMDIIVSSTPKLDAPPVSETAWSPGSVMIPLDVTGAWADAVYWRADHVACDHPGNLALAFQRYRPNLVPAPRAMLSIPALTAGDVSFARAPTDRVLAFMTGVGSLDLSVALEVLRRAERAGLGQRFAFE